MKVIETPDGWIVRCPNCKQHTIPKRWNFNGNVEFPSFGPSVNETVNMPDMKGYQPMIASSRCHFTITNGRIQFHGDCTHDLKNQTFELEHWPQTIVRYYQVTNGD